MRSTYEFKGYRARTTYNPKSGGFGYEHQPDPSLVARGFCARHTEEPHSAAAKSAGDREAGPVPADGATQSQSLGTRQRS